MMKKLIVLLLLLCLCGPALAEGGPWEDWGMTGYIDTETADHLVALNRGEHNALAWYRWSGQGWTLIWASGLPVPQGASGLGMTDLTGAALGGRTLGTAFAVGLMQPGHWESIYEWDGETWQLRAMVYIDTDGQTVTDQFLFHPDHVLYIGWRTAAPVRLDIAVQTDLRLRAYGLTELVDLLPVDPGNG